ncbi:glycosyltransferase family 61 protein [Neobacillus sp. DY30]|uniref:glycosyltransferase family 61 protein n=1 Tax=Neobacillus sp. DY30 TaxID=3047871 RepID=UPI0024C0B7F3|nr:glycosyltransferase family 61 protein [Neobacillus sp. DY30]WHX98459.1 glycosyltransferase family 61 protein [Neobacillus sp. DY30]
MTEEILPPKDFYFSIPDWANNTGNQECLFGIYPELKIPDVSKEEEYKIISGKSEYSNKGLVAILPGGRVLSDNAVISPDNKLIYELSVEWRTPPEKHSIFKKNELPPVTMSEETVALLNHPAASNYYHWMLEAMARIHLMQQSNIKIDRYIINHRSLPFQLETLQACGIPEDRIIVPHNDFHFKAKQLVVPSYINYPNAWSCKYIRNLLLNPEGIKKDIEFERIYIMRTNRRRVRNEKEILQVLNDYGFKIIFPETMSVQKQIEIFQSAKIIVSAHGAALANLVFCEPGTRVVELFASSYIEMHYWLISRLMNLDYRFIIGKRRRKRRKTWWSGFDDMVIDKWALINELQ